MSDTALNLLLYLVVIFALPAIFGVLFWTTGHADEIAERVRVRFGHRRPPEPTGRPLAAIARDLRRLADQAGSRSSDTTFARSRGLELAYDDVLVQACRALEITEAIRAVPPGWQRDIERLRVEACLENAGLAVRAR
ncbi:MAG: hypothetical protein ACR2FF_10605 [Mycobacteriales bacterium]